MMMTVNVYMYVYKLLQAQAAAEFNVIQQYRIGLYAACRNGGFKLTPSSFPSFISPPL